MKFLTQSEVDALDEGTKVLIVWGGGNGPHEYTIHKPWEGHSWAKEANSPITSCGSKSPSTLVWLVPTQYCVEFDQEIHCDKCNEIVHVHFEEVCPVCGKEHAGTNIYGMSVSELLEDHGGLFECSHCNTKFEILCQTEPEFLWIIEVIELPAERQGATS